MKDGNVMTRQYSCSQPEKLFQVFLGTVKNGNSLAGRHISGILQQH